MHVHMIGDVRCCRIGKKITVSAEPSSLRYTLLLLSSSCLVHAAAHDCCNFLGSAALAPDVGHLVKRLYAVDHVAEDARELGIHVGKDDAELGRHLVEITK